MKVTIKSAEQEAEEEEVVIAQEVAQEDAQLEE